MYDESRERTMPVKTAMKSAIGTESTPRRRICAERSGSQGFTSARARPVSRLRRPTCATNPSGAGSRDVREGNTDSIKRVGGYAGRRDDEWVRGKRVRREQSAS